jgi:cysteine dioxygenase
LALSHFGITLDDFGVAEMSLGAGKEQRSPAFFAPLDTFDQRIPLAVLNDWLQSLEISLNDVQPFVRFHPDHYLRNLIRQGPAYQALVLCWRNGQRSPIHDHEGSSCAVKVMAGVATETLFDRAPNGMVFATGSRNLAAGYTTASQDADIHQMSNLQPGDAELITLHVYSPPLLSMHVYSLLNADVSRFFDPINDEFVGGAGI